MKKISRRISLNALILEQFNQFGDKLIFCNFTPLGREVKCNILINPNPTFAIFVNEHHFTRDVK